MINLHARINGSTTGSSIALSGTATTLAEGVPAQAHALADSPDAPLFSLGRAWTAMVQRCADLDASADSTAAERAVARAMTGVIERRILATPAFTLEGLDVKAILPDTAINTQ